CAICIQAIAAVDAQPRLQRSGRVVEPGVNDAAVVRRAVLARTRVTFDDADRTAAQGECPRDRQTNDSGSDDAGAGGSPGRLRPGSPGGSGRQDIVSTAGGHARMLIVVCYLRSSTWPPNGH